MKNDRITLALLIMLLLSVALNVFFNVRLASYGFELTEQRAKAEKCEEGQQLMVMILKAATDARNAKDIQSLEKEMARDCYPRCPAGAER